jgi:hypothetical protein
MSYEVIVDELTAAARKFRTVQDAMSGYNFPEQGVTAEAFGHVELADWVIAVVEQCDNAGGALHTGAQILADDLVTQALDYEATDQAAQGRFGGPR